MNSNKILDEAYKIISNANDKILHAWVTDIVFSWRWWLGIALSILPWIVWIKIRDKKHTTRLLFVGIVAMLVTVSMDNIGISFNLWYYYWKVTPFLNAFLPWDFTLFPVSIMIILQFNPKINVYIKAVAFAFFSAFIVEPFFVWMNMYHIVSWKYWYSLIIYFPLYLVFNYIYKSKLFCKCINE